MNKKAAFIGGGMPSRRTWVRRGKQVKHDTLDDVSRGESKFSKRKRMNKMKKAPMHSKWTAQPLRVGSAPYTHYKVGSMIQTESSLSAIQHQEVTGLRTSTHDATPVPKVDNALYTTTSSRLTMPIPPFTTKTSTEPFEFHLIKEDTHPPTLRNLSDNKTYYTRLNLHEGRRSKKRRVASKIHPTSNEPTFETTKLEACDMIVQTHGINQTGFYCPYDISDVYDVAPKTSKNVMKFLQGQQEVWSTARNAVSATTQGQLDALQGNVDAFFSFDSVIDTSTFRNRSEYTPGQVKVYLLQARVDTGLPPWLGVHNDWESGNIPIDYLTPRKGLSLSDSNTDYDDAGTTTPFPTAPNSTKIWTDNAAVLGFTPQLSPWFREHWAVVDVYKSPVLNPGDQWQFQVKQHKARMLSWVDSLYKLGGNSTLETHVRYFTGDYELLVQFQGAPGFCVNTALDLSPDGVKGNRVNSIQTFSNPMMIGRTRKSSIVTNFPSSMSTGLTSDLTEDLFDTVQAKRLNTDARKYPYFPSYSDPAVPTSIQYDWRATAMSDTDQKTADSSGL